MSPSLLGGLTKSLAMTVLSEVGDKTFFAAAVMTALSASLGWAAPNLDADFKSNKGESKNKSKATEDTKKKQRPFLMQFFSPIFIKAFSITFFGEWGDKSQIATIGLAADENPFGVVIGGVIAQALCTTAAVMGGKSLASQISEKMDQKGNCNLSRNFGRTLPASMASFLE
uniref:GDT1 family protein n=1 Tax=Aegilops tauschii TaxID=37682 RepID=M8CL00_AEGTA